MREREKEREFTMRFYGMRKKRTKNGFATKMYIVQAQ